MLRHRFTPPAHVGCTDCLPSPRSSIALAWKSVLQISRAALIPREELVPEVLPDAIQTPYLGWVGENWRGGTLVLARNPGGGGDSQHEPQWHDAAVQRALLVLRDGPADSALANLDALAAAYHQQAPHIGMGRLLERIVSRLGEQRRDIAFLNALPYRTRKDEHASAAEMRRCMELVVAPLLERLRPDTVVVLGSQDTTKELRQWFTAPWVESIRRPRADAQRIPDEGNAALARLEAANAQRRQFRAKRGV